MGIPIKGRRGINYILYYYKALHTYHIYIREMESMEILHLQEMHKDRISNLFLKYLIPMKILSYQETPYMYVNYLIKL